MHGDHLRVYHTPEAHANGHYYEHFCIIEVMEDGIFAHQGPKNTVFLPWAYLNKYSYEYR